MVNRKDFRPSNNSSRGISDKDRKLIQSKKSSKNVDEIVEQREIIGNYQYYKKDFPSAKKRFSKQGYKKIVFANEVPFTDKDTYMAIGTRKYKVTKKWYGNSYTPLKKLKNREDVK